MRIMDTNFCSETATTIVASSEDSNFRASNLKHPFRSKRWRSTGCTSENVVFDFQTTEEIDSVVLLWSKEDGIKLTNSAVVKIQANATDVWTSPAVDQTLTINNDYSIASHYFTTDQTYRYWRIVIEDSSNPWGYVELGVAWIGKSIAVENAQNGFKFGIEDQSVITETDYGHKYVDEYPQKTNVEFSYAYLDYTTVQALEDAYRRNGSRKPVLMALDAEAAVFNKDHFTIYGNLGKSFALAHVNYNLFNADGIKLEELS